MLGFTSLTLVVWFHRGLLSERIVSPQLQTMSEWRNRKNRNKNTFLRNKNVFLRNKNTFLIWSPVHLFQVTIEATDSDVAGSRSSTQTATVRVTRNQTPPTFSQNGFYSGTIEETVGLTTSVLRVTATDIDAAVSTKILYCAFHLSLSHDFLWSLFFFLLFWTDTCII